MNTQNLATDGSLNGPGFYCAVKCYTNDFKRKHENLETGHSH